MSAQTDFQTDRPIGMFDSGVGGLTVVREIIRLLPNEEIIYFGDTARVPYGTKSKETVVRFSIENVKFLMKFNVKLIIVACNTASSLSLTELKAQFDVPFVGVIEPGARKAVQVTKNNRIGVIGTPATIASRAYEREIKQLEPNVEIFTQSCPLFVSLVEEGWTDDNVTYDVAKRYLTRLAKAGVDTVILGCTHYPLLKGVVSHVIGNGIKLVDSAKETANLVRKKLLSNGLSSEKRAQSSMRVRFYVSDEPERFTRVGEAFLARKIEFVERVTI